MTDFSIGSLRNNSIWSIYRLRDAIDLEPEYQRESDIWTLEKKQLLIDTILNGFDLPKIYIHRFLNKKNVDGRQIEYAVVDGKQRLSAIWDFIEGGFALSDEFSYVKDESIILKNKTYDDIAQTYPDLKSDLDSFLLDIVVIETDDIELIEDMFSRLNEAMPLNAAEKRNARPGPLPKAVRHLVFDKSFFLKKLPFTNRRYRHYDIASKMLLLVSRDVVSDTKKAYVDAFFKRHRKSKHEDIAETLKKSSEVLDRMSRVFIDKDPLLRSVGMVILYFLVFARLAEIGKIKLVKRPMLLEFEERRIKNRRIAVDDIAKADYKLLEFDRYTQSPNDGIALRYRLAVVDEILFDGVLKYNEV